MELETSRLIIRHYNLEDVEDASEFLLNEETMHFIPEKFKTKQEVMAFIEVQSQEAKFFPVVLKDEGKVIGHLSFEPFFGDHSYEIGWVFHEGYHQKGYAKEASNRLLDYGFSKLNIHRVIATCQPENPGSWRLMESLGMRKEGDFKQCIPLGDSWWDEYYYAILKEEWPT